VRAREKIKSKTRIRTRSKSRRKIRTKRCTLGVEKNSALLKDGKRKRHAQGR
jgi:hypothetical protein